MVQHWKLGNIPSDVIGRSPSVLALAAFMGASGVGIYTAMRWYTPAETNAPVPEAIQPEVRTVTALGRLEPKGEIVKLSAPVSNEGSRVEKLLVKEGDSIKTGQEIAILDSRDRLLAALAEAEQAVSVAQANLAKVQAGSKRGEIAAQKAEIARIQAQLQGDKTAQQESIYRIEAQWQGDKTAQQETIERIQAQWEGDKTAQQETISRIQAQWEGDKTAQQETIERIQAQWQGDRTAQQATIKKLEAQLENAQAEYKRYEEIYKQGAISRSVYESKSLAVETALQQLNEAKAVLNRINTTGSKQLSEAKAVLNRINSTGSKQLSEAKAVLNRINTTGSKQLSEAKAVLNRINSTGSKQLSEAKAVLNRTNSTGSQQIGEAQATLDRIAEVRPVDVEAAKAEVRRAMAAMNQAKVNLDRAIVRSPQEGTVLEIHARPGELVSNDGIIDIGQTNQMYAIAEIYQSDINNIRPGQSVRISSDSLPEELQGTVDSIGWQVKRQNIVNTDPSANIDARIVEVHIKLDEASSQKAAKFTNLQVKVVVELDNHK
ncbi:efflux RND transporter periplasmic adaptor subunit [Microseira sp. BLCC-F43]|uniref:efflux RND transporter periplasmic adaptor subunit n=1 Tax=Microseira sp. BLCC-F43 TaxID=3153602 RepID=UPI0035BA69FD